MSRGVLGTVQETFLFWKYFSAIPFAGLPIQMAITSRLNQRIDGLIHQKTGERGKRLIELIKLKNDYSMSRIVHNLLIFAVTVAVSAVFSATITTLSAFFAASFVILSFVDSCRQVSKIAYNQEVIEDIEKHGFPREVDLPEEVHQLAELPPIQNLLQEAHLDAEVLKTILKIAVNSILQFARQCRTRETLHVQ